MASNFGGLTLPEILAQIVDFSRNDYFDGKVTKDYPFDVAWNTAYICACFVAQHTPQGEDGVDTEVTYEGLKVTEELSFAARVALATELLTDWGYKS